MKIKCEYCGLPLKTKDPNKKTHKLCDRIKIISGGRNLTYANEDSYPMSYISEEYTEQFDNLHPNSRGYVYTHELVAQVLLGRKLKVQSDGVDEAEVVDHIGGPKSKKNFSPSNLRVMKLQDHVSSHKSKDSTRKFK